jgi:vacuolar protein sorting-associated protein 26
LFNLIQFNLLIFPLDENIPIKFFLSPYQLGPTYSNVNNRFSVQYFINLVLMDVEDRRYFKQHEINMIRIDKKKLRN